jgi:ribosome-binding protein aMBF1 (putative translation factor)
MPGTRRVIAPRGKNGNGRGRLTAHRLAASKAEVKKRIAALRRDWSRKVHKVLLGEQIRDLIESRGCSYRGLAKEIGEPESTLRRYATLASLCEEDRSSFLRGETAKAILARSANRQREETRIARLKLEKETGTLSDEVADLIIDFCRYDDGEGRILSNTVPKLLEETRWRTRTAYPFSGKLPSDRTQLFRCTRPKETVGEFWLAHCGAWLATILMTVAPESDIREVGMNKAENRRNEPTWPQV